MLKKIREHFRDAWDSIGDESYAAAWGYALVIGVVLVCSIVGGAAAVVAMVRH